MFTSGRVTAVLNRRDFQLLSLMAFALVFNREGDRVPNGNEWIYLLYVYRAWHPGFLAGDWTFLEPTAGHAIFNWVAGLPTLLLPLPMARSLLVVAWTGRILCWFGCFTAILRIARRWPIPPWVQWTAVFLWMIERQSLVTNEWIVGTFEAKCVAYVCLLFAIDFAIDARLWRAGILTGLAFSFHTAVGMWGGAALGAAVLLNSPVRKTAVFCLIVVLFSLPGLVTSIPLVFGPHAISPVSARFLVKAELPGCLDPLVFPLIWPVVMFAMLGFGAAHAVWRWNHRPARMLFQIEAAAGLFYVFGVFARLLGRFDWVDLYPLRVFSVLVMLLFFWQLADLLVAGFGPVDARPKGKAFQLLTAKGVILFFTIPAPGVVMWDTVRSHARHARAVAGISVAASADDDADFRSCAGWIADHAEQNCLVISPPWQNDAYYLMQRRLVADWHAPRYDRMDEWQTRIEALVGPIPVGSSASAIPIGTAFHPDDDLDADARGFYSHLTPAAIERLRDAYSDREPTYLVSTARYPYPVMFKSGAMSVYKLP